MKKSKFAGFAGVVKAEITTLTFTKRTVFHTEVVTMYTQENSADFS